MRKDLFSREKPKAISYAIAVFVGVVVSFLFMLLFAIIIASADLTDGFIAPATSLASALGGLSAGFTASKILKSGGIINGLITGGILFAIVIIVSLFLDRGGLTANTLFNFLIIMISALIGGVLGIGKNKKYI